MPLLAPARRFEPGPDHPPEVRAVEPTMLGWIGAWTGFVYGIGALALFMIRYGMRPDLDSVAGAKAWPFFCAAAGLAVAYAMRVASGATLQRFLRPFLVLVVLAPFALGAASLPRAAGPGFIEIRAAWLLFAGTMGALAALLVGTFLTECTRRGARLIQARWQSPTLRRWIIFLAVATIACRLLSPEAASIASERAVGDHGGICMTAVAVVLLGLFALTLFAIGQRLTGSAFLGFSFGFLWLAVLGTSDSLLAVDWRGGAALHALGVLVLARMYRNVPLAAAAAAAVVLSQPQWLFALAFLGIFMWAGQRDSTWGLTLAALAFSIASVWLLVVFAEWAYVAPPAFLSIGEFLVFGDLPSFSFMFAAALHLLLASALPLLVLNNARRGADAILVDPVFLLAWLGLITVGATPEGEALWWAAIFYASMLGAQRFAYGRAIDPMPVREAFLHRDASPEGPPPEPPRAALFDSQDLPRLLFVVPRPWAVEQIIRLRSLTTGLCAAALTLIALDLLRG